MALIRVFAQIDGYEPDMLGEVEAPTLAEAHRAMVELFGMLAANQREQAAFVDIAASLPELGDLG